VISAPTLKSRAADAAAKRCLAVSSVAPIYASALSYTHLCVYPNANAYHFSPATGTTFSGGGLE
jgi:hypothetical protein